MSQTMIGHRGKDFEELYASIQPGLQELFGTTRPVFLSTSSAWGVMEGALRNLATRKCSASAAARSRTSGSTSPKSAAIEADSVQVEWGQPIDPGSRARQARGRRIRHRDLHPRGDLHRRAQRPRGRYRQGGEILPGHACSSWTPFPRSPPCRWTWMRTGIDVMLAGVPEGARAASGPRRLRRFRSGHGTRQGQRRTAATTSTSWSSPRTPR